MKQAGHHAEEAPGWANQGMIAVGAPTIWRTRGGPYQSKGLPGGIPGAPHHHSTIINRNEITSMTESINSTSPAQDDDDDIFENSSDEFAKKADLKDRLVMIYPTGKTGKRVGDNGPYDWYETYTVVLDDGPDGWQEQVLDTELETPAMRPNRVPSVAEFGPQVLEGYQWSAGGVVVRIKDKVPAKHDGVPVGLLGRIDAKGQKGKTAAWRPNPPTDADKARAVEPAIKAARLKARDEIVAALKAAEVEDAF